MPKNLNSSILPDSVIEIMKKKLVKTEKVRRELGFNLCQVEGSNQLQDDTHCIGSDCRIALEKTCKVGKKVGLFHTHPGNGEGTSGPSLSDLENAYYYGMNCVGGATDKKIKCYVRKDKEFSTKDYKTIRYYREKYSHLSKVHHITSEKGRQMVLAKFRERDYAIDALKKSYFNTVDIV